MSRLSLVAIAHLALSTASYSQQRADPVSIGQGRASISTARGLSALYSNVGAIGLDRLGQREEEPSVEVDLSIAPFGIAAGSTYLSPSDLEFVFGPKDCGIFTEQDRLRLHDLLEPERLAADAAVDLLAFRLRIPSVGALAVQYGHHIRARVNLPENFRTYILGRGDIFSTDQTFQNVDVAGEWVRRLKVSLASGWNREILDSSQSTWLPSVGFGMSVSRMTGVVHFDADPESQLRTRRVSGGSETFRSLRVDGGYAFRTSVPENFKAADAVLRPGFSDSDSSAAEGWGGDIGLSMVLYRDVRKITDVRRGDPLNPQRVYREEVVSRDAIMLGMAVEELGYLVWDGSNLRRTRTFDTIVTDVGGGVTSQVICSQGGVLDTIGSFRTALPARFRVGAGVDITAFVPEIPGDLIAEIETAVDLNDAIGSEGATRVSIGGFWTPMRWLTLRSGLQLGGRIGTTLAFGASLRPFSWLTIDAATSELSGLLEDDPLRYDLAFRIGTNFSF